MMLIRFLGSLLFEEGYTLSIFIGPNECVVVGGSESQNSVECISPEFFGSNWNLTYTKEFGNDSQTVQANGISYSGIIIDSISKTDLAKSGNKRVEVHGNFLGGYNEKGRAAMRAYLGVEGGNEREIALQILNIRSGGVATHEATKIKIPAVEPKQWPELKLFLFYEYDGEIVSDVAVSEDVIIFKDPVIRGNVITPTDPNDRIVLAPGEEAPVQVYIRTGVFAERIPTELSAADGAIVGVRTPRIITLTRQKQPYPLNWTVFWKGAGETTVDFLADYYGTFEISPSSITIIAEGEAVTGACCRPQDCEETLESDCDGDWLSEEGCAECDSIVGTCCSNGGCSQVAAGDCDGSFLGTQGSCLDCPSACCREGLCSLEKSDDCSDGVWLFGEDCAAGICDEGFCCNTTSDSDCEFVIRNDCEKDSFDVEECGCLDAVGYCCNSADGTCFEELESECEGSFSELEADCNSSCSAPVYCCENGDCQPIDQGQDCAGTIYADSNQCSAQCGLASPSPSPTPTPVFCCNITDFTCGAVAEGECATEEYDDESTCSSRCQEPIGSCCTPSTICVSATATECDSGDGEYYEEEDTCLASCKVFGYCCEDETCTLTDQDSCTSSFFLDETECGESCTADAEGFCCEVEGESCAFINQTDCNGIFSTDQTACDESCSPTVEKYCCSSGINTAKCAPVAVDLNGEVDCDGSVFDTIEDCRTGCESTVYCCNSGTGTCSEIDASACPGIPYNSEGECNGECAAPSPSPTATPSPNPTASPAPTSSGANTLVGVLFYLVQTLMVYIC
eukprot:TRINITY_DN2853_c0_g1_i1.p1 TRINITY_DN2853_c0_g1~~TRINITY_DN2853_c0_g1_i1.p1  ORF type:complete len:795 (-),score=105.74 TRINITY_DN2853_c0_g1_i1:74-2458(-)